jgi:hypothetical protein
VPPDKAGPERVNRLIEFVDKIIDLKKRILKTKAPHDKELLERQISMITARIDEVVCDLYGVKLTEIPKKA